ncbi:hypothetical protein SLEP1_g60029 [Rubroshorea leprosula]|uniref:Uncharacterized protein n=1 Tax=Rubroshorea leprosula TaxID=152421 RepID=A0AAV5MVN1_9ROSI|nr:hypothetical protein SLEP1_g60029 [Rubroshorea leprosula]
METIPTDSAYKALSRKVSNKSNVQMYYSVHNERPLVNSNDQDKTFELNNEGQQVASRCVWHNFYNKFQKVEDVDMLVNYGLVIMLPLLVVSTWLSQ